MIHTRPLKNELDLSRETPAQIFAREEAFLEDRDIPVEPSDEDKEALARILAVEEVQRKKNERVQARIRGFRALREQREQYHSAVKPAEILEQEQVLLPLSEATTFCEKLKEEISQNSD